MIKLFSKKEREVEVVEDDIEGFKKEERIVEYDYVISERDIFDLQQRFGGKYSWDCSFDFYGQYGYRDGYKEAVSYLRGVTANLPREEDANKIRDICSLIEDGLHILNVVVRRVEKTDD